MTEILCPLITKTVVIDQAAQMYKYSVIFLIIYDMKYCASRRDLMVNSALQPEGRITTDSNIPIHSDKGKAMSI